MSTITVVRSLVGEKLSLPGDVVIREWHFREFTKLTDEQRVAIKQLIADRKVHVAQVRNGMPLDKPDLSVLQEVKPPEK